MKTAEDFKKSALENNIHHWPIHNCSLCRYECGYMFNFRDCEVVYDHGCDCVSMHRKSVRSWDNVAEYYNMQQNPETIKKMNEYWRFTE
jgi:hypothetical protein